MMFCLCPQPLIRSAPPFKPDGESAAERQKHACHLQKGTFAASNLGEYLKRHHGTTK